MWGCLEVPQEYPRRESLRQHHTPLGFREGGSRTIGKGLGTTGPGPWGGERIAKVIWVIQPVRDRPHHSGQEPGWPAPRDSQGLCRKPQS